jgi:hypothetical protein
LTTSIPAIGSVPLAPTSSSVISIPGRPPESSLASARSADRVVVVVVSSASIGAPKTIRRRVETPPVTGPRRARVGVVDAVDVDAIGVTAMSVARSAKPRARAS